MSQSPVTSGTQTNSAATDRGAAHLWRYVGIVAAVHVVAILALSPRLYWSTGPTLEEQLASGEAAMQAEEYDKAKVAFQSVLDAQPKPAPIFVKAAELHRRADRMLRTQGPGGPQTDEAAEAAESANVPATDPNTTTPDKTTTTPTKKPADQPAKPGELPDFIPPELRLGD